MSDLTMELQSARVGAWGWGAAFFGGMIAVPLAVHLSGMRTSWTPALIFLPMPLLIPYMRAIRRFARARGTNSPAGAAYNKRMVAASFVYVAALLGAVYATQALNAHGPLAWALALLPSLPILAMLWAMGRYLIDETDEYLRARVVFSALVATGLLLAVATFWGFLESFRLTPHVPSWAAVPLWSAGLGLGGLLHRGRA